MSYVDGFLLIVPTKNLPAYKSVEELEKVKDDSPDIVLTQSAEIMADIVTGEKTVLAYLAKPVRNALSTALSER